MSRTAWEVHMARLGLSVTRDPASLEHTRSGCADCEVRKRTRRASLRRRERDAAMRSLGLVKTSYGWE